MEVRVHFQKDLKVSLGFKLASQVKGAVTAINLSYFAPGANPTPVGVHYANGKFFGDQQGHPWHFFALAKKGPQVYCEHMPFGISASNTPDWALAAGPLLVLEGKKVDIAYKEWNAGGTDVLSRRARVAVGLRDPWAYLVYVGEGEMSCPELAEFFVRIGCTQAIAGDGGGSASMAFDGFSVASRLVPAVVYATAPALYKIAIDAGHGGADPGAVRGDTLEKTLNLSIAADMIRFMAQSSTVAPVPIYLSDTDIPLKALCDLANLTKSHLFISHHNNASASDRPGTGREYFSVSANGARLARNIERYMAVASPLSFRGFKTARFQVLVQTTMPALLIEHGFVDNARDVKVINDPVYRGGIGLACTLGVEDYFKGG